MTVSFTNDITSNHGTDSDVLNVIRIVAGTSVDGPGLRTSIYFAGCSHHCPGCHNPESWDYNAGSPMTVDQIMQEIKREGFNVTFSGGDPVYQLKPLIKLAEKIHSEGLTIWLYTGFRYEELLDMTDFAMLKPHLEAIVDGPFIESLRDIQLQFRGSSNQRILMM